MSETLTHFLLIYDRKQRTLTWENLGVDAEAAAARYLVTPKWRKSLAVGTRSS